MEAVHADPARLPLVRELLEMRAGAGESVVARAIRSGHAVLVQDHAAEVLAGTVPGERFGELLRALAPVSVIIVALPLEGGTRGAVLLLALIRGREAALGWLGPATWTASERPTSAPFATRAGAAAEKLAKTAARTAKAARRAENRARIAMLERSGPGADR